MKEYSVFAPLNKDFDVEVPKDFKKVHQLIYDVKKDGATPRILNNFKVIVEELDSKDIFLACTELPLLKLDLKEKNLIDVTQLLANKLVEKSFESTDFK